MIAHNKQLLDDLALLEEANSLQNAGFISKEQKDLIKKQLPDFKNQKYILVRLGFFLLGSFLYGSICGAISIVGMVGDELYFKICCYIFAGVGFAGAEGAAAFAG